MSSHENRNTAEQVSGPKIISPEKDLVTQRQEVIGQANTDVTELRQTIMADIDSLETMATNNGVVIEAVDKQEFDVLIQEVEVAKAELLDGLSRLESDDISPDIAGKIEAMKVMARSFDDLDRNKQVGPELIKQCLEKAGTLSRLLSDSNYSHATLEAIRFNDIKQEGNEDEGEQLVAEIVASLEHLEKQLQENEIGDSCKEERDMRRRFRNNAFFAISKGIKSKKKEESEKVAVVLNRHFVDIFDPSMTEESYVLPGSYDTINQFTMENMTHSDNDELIDKVFDRLIDKDVDSLMSLVDGYELDGNSSFKDMVAKKIARRCGLSDEVVKKWQMSTHDVSGKKDKKNQVLVPYYSPNLRSVLRLEAERSGAARELYESFGIANFGRYNDGMLMRQLEEIDEMGPYGVVVFPEADWNGAFFQDNVNLSKVSGKLDEKGIKTRIVEVGSQFGMAKRLAKFNKKYGKDGEKISFLFIGGHGSVDTVNFGKENKLVEDDHHPGPPPLQTDDVPDDVYQKEMSIWRKEYDEWQSNQITPHEIRNTMQADDIRNGSGAGIKRGAEKYIKPKAPVIFISCSTGAEGGIAQTVSGELGFETVGPDKPAAVSSMDVSFDDEGKPSFSISYNKPLDSTSEGGIKKMSYTDGRKNDEIF